MTDQHLTRLRLKLTALYFAATVGFLALVSGIAYGLIHVYFESTTDLSLRNRTAYEYVRLGLPLPSDLALANEEWDRLRGRTTPVESERHGKQDDEDDEAEEHGEARRSPLTSSMSDDLLGELSSVFVIALDDHGQRLLPVSSTGSNSFVPDAAAVAAARANGSDLRTVSTTGGVPVRLLTTKLTIANPSGGATYLQAGRVLTDQEVILRQLLIGLFGAGGVLAVLATLSSWWLAGRSLRPTQQAWERQRAFVANASHELRTPLSLIHLSAEAAARDDTTDAERRELAGDVLRESQYMTRLVADLLLLSRLDAGQLKLDLQPVSVAEVLAEAQRDVARLAGERNVSIAAGQSAGTVMADRVRLRQVLLVVLDNALRHTPPGGRVTLESRERGKWTDVIVTDTGEGIPAEHLSRVFDRFYQADTAHSTQGSAGLGLPIAKSLVEAMRGSISLTSAPGRGTQVVVSLPTSPRP